MNITRGSGTPAPLIFQSALADLKAAPAGSTYRDPGVAVSGTPFGGTYFVQNTGITKITAGTGVTVTPSAAPNVGEVVVAATGTTAGVTQVTSTDASLTVSNGGTGVVDLAVNSSHLPVQSVTGAGAGILVSTTTGAVTVKNVGPTLLQSPDGTIGVGNGGVGTVDLTVVASKLPACVNQVTSADGSVVIGGTGGVGVVPLSVPIAASEGISVLPGTTGGYKIGTQVHFAESSGPLYSPPVDCILNYEVCGAGGGGGAGDYGTYNGYAGQTMGGGGGGSGFLQTGSIFLPTNSQLAYYNGAGGAGGIPTYLGGSGSTMNGSNGGGSTLVINTTYSITAAGGAGGSARNTNPYPFVAGSGGNGYFGGGAAVACDLNNSVCGAPGTGFTAAANGNGANNDGTSGNGGYGGGNNLFTPCDTSLSKAAGGSGGGPSGGKAATPGSTIPPVPGTRGGGGGGGSALSGQNNASMSGAAGGNGYLMWWFQLLGP